MNPEGVRLILRSKLGKMTVDEKRPEMLPAIAQHERSKCKNSLTAINGPSHAETGMKKGVTIFFNKNIM